VDYFGPLGAELVRRVAPAVGASVLDLGCGRGHVLFPVAAAVGPTGRVVGTDLSVRMVEACAAQAAAAGLTQVSVQVGDAAAPDFPPGSFDVVTAGMVMFFVPAPRAAVRAVARLLRPGGRFAMSSFGPSDPKFAETMGILYRHREGPPWEEATDKPFDSAEGIAGMLAEAGFTDVRVEELAHEIAFATVDQYWAWVGSHGGRILIDAVGPARLPAAKDEVYAMLMQRQLEEGGLVHRATARFALARVPG
jgi:ubiquinone/menaquinone biosynthesis C-methylase UbiE